MAFNERAEQQDWSHTGAGAMLRRYYEIRDGNTATEALVLFDMELHDNGSVPPAIRLALMGRKIKDELSSFDPSHPQTTQLLRIKQQNKEEISRFNHPKRPQARHSRIGNGATGR